MADHIIVNTSEPGSEVIPRVSTKQRGGDITPDGNLIGGRTDGPRGKMPQSNGGPSGPEPASVGTGPKGDHLEAHVATPELVAPIATRQSADDDGPNPSDIAKA